MSIVDTEPRFVFRPPDYWLSLRKPTEAAAKDLSASFRVENLEALSAILWYVGLDPDRRSDATAFLSHMADKLQSHGDALNVALSGSVAGALDLALGSYYAKIMKERQMASAACGATCDQPATWHNMVQEWRRSRAISLAAQQLTEAEDCYQWLGLWRHRLRVPTAFLRWFWMYGLAKAPHHPVAELSLTIGDARILPVQNSDQYQLEFDVAFQCTAGGYQEHGVYNGAKISYATLCLQGDCDNIGRDSDKAQPLVNIIFGTTTGPSFREYFSHMIERATCEQGFAHMIVSGNTGDDVKTNQFLRVPVEVACTLDTSSSPPSLSLKDKPNVLSWRRFQPQSKANSVEEEQWRQRCRQVLDAMYTSQDTTLHVHLIASDAELFPTKLACNYTSKQLTELRTYLSNLAPLFGRRLQVHSLDLTRDSDKIKSSSARKELEEYISTISTWEKAPDGEYHIIHFIGHGTLCPEANGGTTYLWKARAGWKDKDNAGFDDTEGLGAEELADFLNDRAVAFVYLCVCDSAYPRWGLPERDSSRVTEGAHPDDQTYSVEPKGFLEALIDEGIPAILAFRSKINSAAANEFAQSFYEHALAYGFYMPWVVRATCEHLRTHPQWSQQPGHGLVWEAAVLCYQQWPSKEKIGEEVG